MPVLADVVSDVGLGSFRHGKVSQSVWQTAGLLVANVLKFVKVRVWSKGSERGIWFRSASWFEADFSMSASLKLCSLFSAQTWLEFAWAFECGLLSVVESVASLDRVGVAKCLKACEIIQAYLSSLVYVLGSVVLSVKVRWPMWSLLGVAAANIAST